MSQSVATFNATNLPADDRDQVTAQVDMAASVIRHALIGTEMELGSMAASGMVMQRVLHDLLEDVRREGGDDVAAEYARLLINTLLEFA